jgi:uncharacterized protein YcfL
MHKLLTSVVLSFLLLGCGSSEGIDAIPQSNTTVNQYIGEWANSQASCIPVPGANLDPNDYSSIYKYHQEAIIDIYSDSYVKRYRFFLDDQCITWVGELQELYELEWFAPTAAQVITDSVRVKAKAIGVQGDTGVLTLVPDWETKMLFQLNGNTLTLYESPQAGLQDTDGYPVGITPTAIFEKTQ